MQRYLVVEEKRGQRTSHGFVIYLPDNDLYIASQPLAEPANGIRYFISRDGSLNQAVQVIANCEAVPLAAPGIRLEGDTEPYVYRLGLEALA